MSKTIFLFLTCTLLSFTVNAKTQSVFYGDYINCYYELQRVQSLVPFNTKIIVFTPTEIKAMYSKFITEKKYELYSFSPEGFYGTNSNSLKNKYCSTSEPIENYSCAYDFYLKIENNSYPLCYSKTWEGGETFTETVMEAECELHSLEAKNLSFAGTRMIFTIGSEELDHSAFYNILYPLLQRKFENIAHDYIWSPGAIYTFSTDDVIIVDNDTPEVMTESAIKSRYNDLKAIIEDEKFFPYCRKVGADIITKDVLKD